MQVLAWSQAECERGYSGGLVFLAQVRPAARAWTKVAGGREGRWRPVTGKGAGHEQAQGWTESPGQITEQRRQLGAAGGGPWLLGDPEVSDSGQTGTWFFLQEALPAAQLSSLL